MYHIVHFCVCKMYKIYILYDYSFMFEWKFTIFCLFFWFFFCIKMYFWLKWTLVFCKAKPLYIKHCIQSNSIFRTYLFSQKWWRVHVLNILFNNLYYNILVKIYNNKKKLIKDPFLPLLYYFFCAVAKGTLFYL